MHRSIAITVNIMLLACILWATYSSNGGDKSILITLFYHPLLILANLLISIVLGLFKNPAAKIYRQTSIALFVLLLPVLLIATNF